MTREGDMKELLVDDVSLINGLAVLAISIWNISIATK